MPDQPTPEAPQAEQVSDQPEQRAPTLFERIFGASRKADEEPAAVASPEPPEPVAELPKVEPEPEPETVTLTKAELDAKVETARREWQSQKDREIAALKWQQAVDAAEAGDSSVLRAMAAKGDARAQRELANRGEVYELGEAVTESLQQQDARASAAEEYAVIGKLYDDHLVEPLLALLPAEEKAKAIAAGADEPDGVLERRAILGYAAKAIKRLSVDEAKAELRTNKAFRTELLAELRAGDDYEEPDHVPAATAPPNGADIGSLVTDLWRQKQDKRLAVFGAVPK